MRGGVPAHRAFAVLASEPAASAEVRKLAASAQNGSSVSGALAAGPGPGWRVLAAAWLLAEASGGSFAPALEAIGAGLGRLTAAREKREVLLAGPRATVRTVVALPPLALGLGWLMGFDPLAVLLGPQGVPLLITGAGLLLLGAAWARRMVRDGVSGEHVGGLEFVLAGIAISGGAPPGRARQRVADAVDRAGVEWVSFDSLRDGSPLAIALRAASATGAPIGALLAAEARSHGTSAAAGLERAVERLGVRILLPIACCVLPSFVVLGVVPVVISMFTGL